MMKARTLLAAATLAGLTLVATNDRAVAQSANAPRAREGFDYIAESYASGEERKAQPDLWIFELQYKSMRMLELELTDPRSGVKQKDLVYYLVYRAVNRAIETPTDETDTVPVNQYDREPVPDLFIPRITLMTTDSDNRQIVNDSIVPEAQVLIERRERRRLLNSVQVVQRIPAVVPEDDVNNEGISGLAVFRGINPETDYFTLFFSGFSNGYKLVKGPVTYSELGDLISNDKLHVSDQVWNGDLNKDWSAAASVGDLFDKKGVPPEGAEETQWFYTVPPNRADEPGVTIWRKTLSQKYWRPGDRFDQNEREVRTQGPPRWIYRPDDVIAEAGIESVETAQNPPAAGTAVSLK